MLPNIARQAHISPNIKHSLFSIGALCDSGRTVTFKTKYVTVVYKYNIIPRGWRNHHDKLRCFPLTVDNKDDKVVDNKNNLVNNVYEKNPSRVSNLFACNMFQPCKINVGRGHKEWKIFNMDRPHGLINCCTSTKIRSELFGH